MASERTHKAKATSNEPTFKPFELLEGAKLAQALNYYNLEDSATKRKWAVVWAKNNRPDAVSAIQKTKDSDIGTAAALCRMVSLGAQLHDEHEQAILDWVDNLVRANAKPKVPEVAPPKPKKIVLDINFQNYDDAMDSLGVFEIDASKPVEAIRRHCERELANAKAEPGCISPKAKTWFEAALERVLKIQRAGVARKVTAPSKKKIPLEKQIKDVRCASNDPDSGFVGMAASKVMGAKKVYVYDPKYRSLIRLVATSDGIGFNGMNITNVDLEKSGYVTLRKPKEALKPGAGIRELDKVYNGLKESKSGISLRTQDRFLFLGFSA